MKTSLVVLSFGALFGLHALAQRSVVIKPPLPAEAQPIIKVYEQKLSELNADHESKLHALRDKTTAELTPIQDKYTRNAKLDEAVLLRDKIREIRGVLQVSQWRVPQAENIGSKFLIEVIGAVQGPVYGTDVYTSDSNPASAALHAGVLTPNQTAVIEVEIVRGLDHYVGSVRNGVASQNWGPWPVGYRVRKSN